MKDKICTVAFIFFTSIGTVAQTVKNDLVQWGLKGPVLSMDERSYAAIDNFGKLSRGARTNENSDHTFNRSGYHTEQNIYNQNGSLKVRYTYTYSNGLLSEQTLYNPGGSMKARFRYRYNSYGKLAEQLQYRANSILTSKYTYEYDERKNQVAYKWYNEAGQLDEKYSYVYNSNGGVISSSSQNADGTFNSKAAYTYDEAGNVIEEVIIAAAADSAEKRMLQVIC